MKKEEFKKRFLDYFKKLGINDDIAKAEWEAYEEGFYDEGDNDPEDAANECLSYWED